jgi:4a-hydroxytetrahydrobiopterin dehydratase
MPTMHSNEIKLHLQSVPNWSKRTQAILRTFKFGGFLKSIDFVNRIAAKADKMNHHPDIDVRFDQVTLTLSTHDQGGITEKDFLLAKQCDEFNSATWKSQSPVSLKTFFRIATCPSLYGSKLLATPDLTTLVDHQRTG